MIPELFAWLHATPMPRQPDPEVFSWDDDITTWDAEFDTDLRALAVTDPVVAAALTLVDTGGIAVVPTYNGANYTAPSPLLALSHNGGDEDWFVITQASPGDGFDQSHGDYTAERIATQLSPCRFEEHRTPTWVIRICCHA